MRVKLTKDEVVGCLKSLKTYNKIYHRENGLMFYDFPYLDTLYTAFEKVLIGECKKLIISMPPRHGKSVVAKRFLERALGIFPNSLIFYISATNEMSQSFSNEMRNSIKSDFFSEIFNVLGGVEISKSMDTKKEFETTQLGRIKGLGTNTQITGAGYGRAGKNFGGCMVLDDLLKAQDANSPLARRNVIDYYENTLKSRSNYPEAPIIVIAQRLHENDLTGHLLELEKSDKFAIKNLTIELNKLKDGIKNKTLLARNKEYKEIKKTIKYLDDNLWRKVIIPCVDESKKTTINPVIKTYEEMMTIKTINKQFYNMQYQQVIDSMGDGAFKTKYFNWFDYEATTQHHNSYDYICIFCDTAVKTLSEHDYSVFQAWGYKDKKIYLLDMLMGKWDAVELRKKANIYHTHWSSTNKLKNIYIEDRGSGSGLIQELRAIGIIPIGVQRSDNKEIRANNILSFIEAGCVFINRGLPNLDELLSQTSKFPNANNDDCVDCLIDAVKFMIQDTFQSTIKSTEILKRTIRHMKFKKF